jgi:vitamin B12 transporter
MLLIRYNGEEQDPNGVVGSWTRVDLSGRYQLSNRVELYARVENLLDEQYQQILGYGTPGLSGSIGARLQF